MEENEFEMAEQFAQTQRDIRVENARKELEPQRSQRFDGLNCIDCANEIHAARLAGGRMRCTECQTKLEKHNKQYGH